MQEQDDESEPLPFIDDVDEEQEDDHPLQKALDALKTRCKEASIGYEVDTSQFPNTMTVQMRAGKSVRPIEVFDTHTANLLLDNSFERYTFLGDYDAVCSYSDGLIAASINGLGTNPAMGSLRRRIFGLKTGRIPEEGTYEVNLEQPSSKCNTFALLRLGAHPILTAGGFSRSGASLEIRGLNVSTQEDAIRTLELVAKGLFFEIDTRFNIALGLRKLRRAPMGPIPKSDDMTRKPLHLPKYRFDPQPASLYWYGRSATGMPLLQFLAFYQVLEYYFPIASRREAINQTRSILKHPSFTVNDDHDMIRLLDAIAVSRSGAFGDERSQLRAVVESYVTAQDIRAFLNADEKFVEFYAGGKDWKTVSEVKIPLNNPTSDLRTEISERIYDLRCKIVHAKSDGGPAKSDTLLPFSNEAELLGFDIEVIRYIALQALTATSTPIDW